MINKVQRGTYVLAVIVCVALPSDCWAQIPDAIGGKVPTLAPLVREVTPSVVNISVQGRVKEESPIYRDPRLREFYDGSNAIEREVQAVGSGVIVDAQHGYVLTANHVVARRRGPAGRREVGRRTLRLPGRRLTFLQLLITALDVAAAATVLYLLLPEAPPFGAFLLVYLLALAAGVLSHVPGGIGVFEAILLAAFADKLGAAPLAAALLLYRLIYVVLPLLVACLLLLINEGQRVFQTRQTLRAASGLAAPILAVLVFLSGVVLLFSGVTPEIDTRLEHIGFLIPHRLVDASHFGASLVGVLCLLLAQGLRRRLSAAWMLTTSCCWWAPCSRYSRASTGKKPA